MLHRPRVEIPPGTTVVARDALAARQWEAFLAADALAAGSRAWRTPPVVPYGRWLTELLAATGDHAGALLTPAQTLALWQTVIDRSPDRERLITVEGPARWAAEAWALLRRFRVDAEALVPAATEPDFRAFLGWSKTYAAALRERCWIDPAELEGLLAERVPAGPGPLLLADWDEDDAPPAERALLAAWRRHGGSAGRLVVPASQARRARLALADASEERRAAAQWASRRLAENPHARVALVVADLAACWEDVERALEEAFGAGGSPWWSPHAGSLARDPVVGAALARIALLSPAGTFAELSRWLREPAAPDPPTASRALVERELRDDVAAQLPFLEAYRRGGWRQRLQQSAPDVARAIDAALRELGGERMRTPSAWAAAWQRALERLAWPPPGCPHDTLRAWEAALGELRRLTAVLGPVTATQALRELEAIAGRQRTHAPLPVAGVFVFAHPDEVGPGYDCAWLTGFADTYWPEPMRLNPLLPRRLQRAHGMPWSSPQDALRRSARSLERLCARVPEIIASWPARVYDYAAEPSPALRDFAEIALEEALPARRHAARKPERTVLEIVPDPAPPLAGTALRGGAGVLNQQSRSPLRAFCQYRLGARALEPVTSGVPARLQGIAAHRALESLYSTVVREDGAGASPLPSADRVEAAAEEALGAVFGAARGPLAVLFRLERDRLADTLRALLAVEAERPPFTVVAVERRERVSVAGCTLDVRIDRLDRLDDGALAIIDYKTGDAASAGDWLEDRLRDAQVPLYAVHLAPASGAAVLVTLSPHGAEYAGIWERPGMLPGRRRKPRDDSWAAQLDAWRGQLETLVAELAAGDVRVFVAELEPVQGPYAPLTRVQEQLALHRAALRGVKSDD